MQSHRKLQAAFRKFVEEVLVPDGQIHEDDGKPPEKKILLEMAKYNVIAMRLGPGAHLKGMKLLGDVKPEEVNNLTFSCFEVLIDWWMYQFDHFHDLIMSQEIARVHSRAYIDGSGGGTYIGEYTQI